MTQYIRDLVKQSSIYSIEVKHNRTATSDPTVNDDANSGYSTDSSWHNTSTGERWICLDPAVGSAKWVKTSLTLDELGSAATNDTSDFATAAQGSLADSAVQPGDNVTELTNNANYIDASGAPVQTVAGDTGDVTLDTLDINIPNPIGSPTTINDQHDYNDYMFSAGVISGGDLTDNGDGTVDISSGEALLRESASEDSRIRVVTFSGSTGVSLTDTQANYIYLDYNGGTPSIVVGSSTADYNCQDKCILYKVTRRGTTINAVDGRNNNVDANRKHRRLLYETSNFTPTRGGSIIGNPSALYISSTSGSAYFGLTKITHPAFDTSATDTFEYFYRDGAGGWTTTTGNSSIDNTQYDDGSGTLATLSNNSYGIHWVYIILDSSSPRLAVQYGQGNYATLAEAQSAGVPSSPDDLYVTGLLIGRAIVEKGTSPLDAVESSIKTRFESSSPTTHNTLSGLQGGVDGEYYHLTTTQLDDVNTIRLTPEETTSTSYTFQATDTTKFKQHNNSSAITVTIPDDSTMDVPIGTTLQGEQTGAGSVTITGASGVTVNAPGGQLTTVQQYSPYTVFKAAANTWRVYGDMQ